MYDLHTHTFHSDGELGPEELLRRAETVGVEGLAITDHVDTVTLPRILELYANRWENLKQSAPYPVVLGCELTHVQPGSIPDLAEQARKLGAQLVVVHGESPVEPVREGTNRAAVECELVDILAHPGTITPEQAKLAAENGIALEISGRPGHAFANGHVASVGFQAEANLVFSTDAHSISDLMEDETAREVIRGAGVQDENRVLKNGEELFRRAHNRDHG